MLDEILNDYPEENFKICTGYDDAIIGLDTNSMRIVYSMTKYIELLEEEGMTHEEAREYYDYNVVRALPYMGEDAPIIVDDSWLQ
jgi:hypothetical protein